MDSLFQGKIAWGDCCGKTFVVTNIRNDVYVVSFYLLLWYRFMIFSLNLRVVSSVYRPYLQNRLSLS